MRRWSELAERVAATTRTSEKTALLADYFAGLGPDELPDRGRLPDRTPLRRGRPAGGRARLGSDRHDRVGAGRSTSFRPRGGLRPIVGSRDGGRRCPVRGRPRARAAKLANTPRSRRRRMPRSRRHPDRRRKARSCAPSSSAPIHSRPSTSSRSWRASSGSAFGKASSRQRSREALRPADRRGEMGRHAHRRRRAAGRPRPRGSPRRGQSRRLPPDQVHARVAGRGCRRDPRAARSGGLGRGQVRRNPGPAAQAGPRGSTYSAATSTTSADSSRRSSRRPCRSAGTASSTASCLPIATARSCPSRPSSHGSGGSRRRRRSGLRSR